MKPTSYKKMFRDYLKILSGSTELTGYKVKDIDEARLSCVKFFDFCLQLKSISQILAMLSPLQSLGRFMKGPQVYHFQKCARLVVGLCGKFMILGETSRMKWFSVAQPRRNPLKI